MAELDSVYQVKGETPYTDVLQAVQQHFVDDFTPTGWQEWQYKKEIETYITTKGIRCAEVTRLSELVSRLYNSMRAYDVLTEYLKPEIYNTMQIEEIYGRWNCIYLKTGIPGKEKVKLKETFPTPEVCMDIINRITAKFNRVVNEGTPIALGEFSPQIRASVVGPPVTSASDGAEFDIRIVRGSAMTRELLVSGGTISDGALDFITACARYGVNVCIAGATGSGKTGTMYYLLREITKDPTLRVLTIEIECREFALAVIDEKGEAQNDIASWVTRQSDDDRYTVTANKLVETALRFTPDVVGLGEMRNEEALSVAEMAQTGHGAITTIHTKSAEAAYARIVTLCKKARAGYDDATLFQFALDAFPIIVYQQKSRVDGRRRVLTILEGTGYENGKAVVNPLYRYEVTDNIQETHTVIGSFKQVGKISDSLRRSLMENGAPKALVDKF